MTKNTRSPALVAPKKPTFLKDRHLYKFFARNPLLWRKIQLIRYRNSRLIGQIVSPSHHLVLEGFPRSGNSYAVRAFLHANGARRTWSIAHHFHRLPQVLLGKNWERPTIVLVRNPDDAVLSLVALSVQQGIYPSQNSAHFVDSFRTLYEHWHHYYQTIHRLRDAIVLSDFETTTQGFDLVLQAVNTRFERDFAWDGLTDQSAQTEIFKTGGIHLSPHQDRDATKEQMRKYIQHADVQQPRNNARRTYEKLLHHAVLA